MKRSMTVRVILMIFGLLLTGALHAQPVSVRGVIIDDTDGSTLPGVSIVEKGTTNGTSSGMDGEFTLNVEKGAVLVVSFMGYVTQEITVGNRTELRIRLVQDVMQIDEVVVIGYGTVKKTDLTGSVVSVSSKDFNKGAITSPQDLLVGKSAGVIITTSGGAPGSGSTIRVRGGSSLNASNDPLIIIDGVPIANSNVSGSSNFLSFVNPNDIETFTVLKDASATAIYGSRASNGVIIITTKKGATDRPLTISYDGRTSVATATKYIDVYSGDEIREIALDKLSLYGPSSLTKLGMENTNWQDKIFRTAVSHDHNLSLSGAYEKVPYRLSIGYTDENGILENTDLQRITGSLSVDPVFLDGSLKVNMNIKGMSTENNFGDSGAIGSAINMDPTQPVYDDNVYSAGYFQWANYGANLGTPNPVEQLMDVDNRSKVNRILGSIQLNYTIPAVENLVANLNLATDYTESEGHNNRPYTSPSVLTSPRIGRVNEYTASNQNDLLDFYLNYSKDLSGISSKMDATAGYSWQHFQREDASSTFGYRLPGETLIIDTSGSPTENYLVSFFGRVNYSLKERYLLTATARYDGSSRFAEGNQWGLFPSVALAWKINDESFLEGVEILTDLKLRLGWGVTGQQDIGNDYPAQARYIFSSPGSYYPIGGEYIPTLRPNAYDPDIKWEETTTQNIGIDFGFASNRVTGSVDLYKRVTEDLLNTVVIPSGSNFSNTLLTNVGSLENKGLEITLNLVPSVDTGYEPDSRIQLHL